MCKNSELNHELGVFSRNRNRLFVRWDNENQERLKEMAEALHAIVTWSLGVKQEVTRQEIEDLEKLYDRA